MTSSFFARKALLPIYHYDLPMTQDHALNANRAISIKVGILRAVQLHLMKEEEGFCCYLCRHSREDWKISFATIGHHSGRKIASVLRDEIQTAEAFSGRAGWFIFRDFNILTLLVKDGIYCCKEDCAAAGRVLVASPGCG